MTTKQKKPKVFTILNRRTVSEFYDVVGCKTARQAENAFLSLKRPGVKRTRSVLEDEQLVYVIVKRGV